MRLHDLERKVLLNPLRIPLQRIYEAPRLLRGLEGLRGRCLDIGTGQGAFTLSVLEATGCEEVVGVDIDPRLIALARTYVGGRGEGEKVHLALADATTLPFSDGSFDAVFITGVLHHIDDWRIVLEEAYRLLVPDGVLSLAELVTADLPDPVNRFLGHSSISISEMERALSSIGFHIRSIDPIVLGRFVMVRGRKGS
jgi:ubiquinone/menaquinone biosynthesis C-methylase UbiE